MGRQAWIGMCAAVIAAFAAPAARADSSPAAPVAQTPLRIVDIDSTNHLVPYTQVTDTVEVDGAAWNQPLQTYTYELQRCTTACVNVEPLASNQSPDYYTIAPADVGAMLRVVETATNADTSTTVVSNSLGPVTAAGPSISPIPYPLNSPGIAFPPQSIIIDRRDTSTPETFDYVVTQTTPSRHPVFRPMTGQLYMAPGQWRTVITVPAAADHGVPILTPTLNVQLYDGSPQPVSSPSAEQIPVQPSSPGDFTRIRGNPLNLATPPPPSDPLAGARWFVDYTGTAVEHAAAALAATDPSDTAKLDVIVGEPDVTRFGTWNGNYPGTAVQSFLERALQAEPNAIPMLATYKVVNSHLTHPECHHWADSPATQAEYHEWITNLAEGIGYRPAVLFLEMDSLITVGCLSPHGLQIRLNELRDAINVLSNAPHLVVYLDAGAADAIPAKKVASLLERAGIAKIQGFFLNSTHFDWTTREIKYGEEISRLTGGKHFVINTAENGQGPLVPKNRGKQGNEVLCNPPGRGLGPLPTTNTGFKNVDAFAWIANPGVSGGVCGPGQPAGGRFSVQLALGLVRHADFKVR